MSELREHNSALAEDQINTFKELVDSPDFEISSMDGEGIADNDFEGYDSSEGDFQDALNANGSLQRSLDATQLYLNEIGFSPLLSPEEEVYFARLARKGETGRA